MNRMLVLISVIAAAILISSLIGLAIQDYRSLIRPLDRTSRGIFKSKSFWKWLAGVFRCKHDKGHNLVEGKYKQCKNCGQIID